ncbi:hypothetical protein VTL71DRAFT_9029 [Oculimacula yallundae]|uniref:Uncharacterized protein n=1 Tax=Oculimacula yallundae TaxID=86028 RepID=A0ABR4BUD6_9HELO
MVTYITLTQPNSTCHTNNLTSSEQPLKSHIPISQHIEECLIPTKQYSIFIILNPRICIDIYKYIESIHHIPSTHVNFVKKAVQVNHKNTIFCLLCVALFKSSLTSSSQSSKSFIQKSICGIQSNIQVTNPIQFERHQSSNKNVSTYVSIQGWIGE